MSLVNGVGSQTQWPTEWNLTSFSPQTCLELIQTLTDEQILREKDYVLDPKLVATFKVTRNTDVISLARTALSKHFEELITLSNNLVFKEYGTLTTYFARLTDDTERRMTSASKQMESLNKEIVSAQSLISQLTEPLTRLDTELKDELSALDISEEPGTDSNSNTGTVCPFECLDEKPFAGFEADILDSACSYDRKFDNREVAYYGDLPYKYAGAFHSARAVSENAYLSEIAEELKKHVPGIDFNSVMVTKYDSADSFIPPHSDNEERIAADSKIVTVSLGDPRQVLFRRKPTRPGDTKTEVLTTEHGSVYIMTRKSQDFWDHSVPKIKPEDFQGKRLSITFRKLERQGSRRSRAQTRQHSPSSPSSAAAPRDTSTRPNSKPPRKVLILSDSKNASFDVSLFKEPIVAFRENLFNLRDLDQHSNAIRNVDVVLISAGVNDLKHGRADPVTIHDHLANVTRRFKTQFLFDAISNVTMNADRFNRLNDNINYLNELMLQYSLRSDNFKLFDNLVLGTPHLAKDGLHLNNSGKAVVSACWVNCVLKALGLRGGGLPLRYSFRSIADSFYYYGEG